MINLQQLRFPILLALIFPILFTVNSANKARYVNIRFPIFNEGWSVRHFQERGKYFEGDIVPGTNPIGGDPRAGSDSARWKDGLIPYVIHPNIKIRGRQAILAAMQDIQSKTCIVFKPRKNRKPEKDFVWITMFNQGCFSYVGRDGGAQQLNLGPGCWHKTTIIHELVHAVGFWHEQSRLDRDSYVTIQWNNIAPAFRREFSKHSRLNSFNTEYDYNSVMHYSYNAFAKDPRRPTITTKEAYPLRLLGTGDKYGGLTENDALQINRMYNCTGYESFNEQFNLV